METRIETTIQQDGTLTLKDLPFHAGEKGAASGLHLRHGRKPASSAAAADG